MFEPAVYASRREALTSDMPEEYAVIVPPASSKPASADGTYPYTPSKNLVYLTGIDQENTWLVMYRRKGEDPKEVLFVSSYSDEFAKWFGTVLTKEEAAEKSGIEDVRFSDGVRKWIDRLVQRFGISSLYVDFPLAGISSQGGDRLRLANRIRNSYPHASFERISGRIFSSRMLKSREELLVMGQAIDLTDRGFRRALKALEPEMIEYEFSAEILYEFQRAGQTEAFPAIVAGGKMATCLHYVENNKHLQDGDLLLVDFGAQVGLYNADITRTVPVNGRYSDRQRELMEMVLRVQEEAIRLLRPGKLHVQWNSEVNEFYGRLMKEKGLIEDEKEFSRYYYHNIGHHIGMDTHDECVIGAELRPGMVLTVEPGFYSIEEGIGIRIEDDVLIGEEENTVLSSQIPKDPDEIEAVMAGETDILTVDDARWMAFALDEAYSAFAVDEVPVGAVLVTLTGESYADHNRTREKKSPSAHAEALVIETACRARGDWRLEDCTLYSTLEPCLMCGGLAVIARIPRIVFGARDHRFGAFGSVTDIRELPGLNHYPEVTGDFMPERSADILKEFFRKHR